MKILILACISFLRAQYGRVGDECTKLKQSVWAVTHLDHSGTYDGKNDNWYRAHEEPGKDKAGGKNGKCADHRHVKGDKQETQCDNNVQRYGLIIRKIIKMLMDRCHSFTKEAKL